MEESFKKLIKKGTNQNRIQLYVFYAILGVVVVGNLVTINGDNYAQNLTFAAVISIIFAIYYWFNRYRFLPLKFWYNIIENEPDKLVWVKPITTEHKAYFFTYSKSFQFEIYLSDGTHVKIDCPESHKRIFYRMIGEHTPHAHVGYSKDVAKIYRKHRKRFIQRLNEKGLYNTVEDYNLV